MTLAKVVAIHGGAKAMLQNQFAQFSTLGFIQHIWTQGREKLERQSSKLKVLVLGKGSELVS